MISGALEHATLRKYKYQNTTTHALDSAEISYYGSYGCQRGLNCTHEYARCMFQGLQTAILIENLHHL